MRLLLPVIVLTTVTACQQTPRSGQPTFPKTGQIERLDPGLDAIIRPDAVVEVIAEGFDWSEGPLWVESADMLLFSDVPKNRVYKWTEAGGTEVYLEPSGYTGVEPSNRREPGSNGLTLDQEGRLVLCQHGDRRMARMETPLDQPEALFTTLVDCYTDKRLNSPNDVVYDSRGDLFFTDPPYGLPRQNDDDPIKELNFNGVYRLASDGTLHLLTDTLTRPNGLAFFPDESKLLVANSDPAKPNWYLISLDEDRAVTDIRIFHRAAGGPGMPGLPDGLKIDRNGIVFASGPGGVWIFDADAKVLGKIRLEQPASNVALSADEKTMYITNDSYVLRIRMQ